MRHRAARSLMTHCPFHCTLDEAVGLSAGVNTNRQHPRVSQGPLAPAKTRAGGGGKKKEEREISEVNTSLRTSFMTQWKASCCDYARLLGSQSCITHDTSMPGTDAERRLVALAAGWPCREGNLFLSLSVSPSGAFFFFFMLLLFFFSFLSEEVKREMYNLTRESQEESGGPVHTCRASRLTHNSSLWHSESLLGLKKKINPYRLQQAAENKTFLVLEIDWKQEFAQCACFTHTVNR